MTYDQNTSSYSSLESATSTGSSTSRSRFDSPPLRRVSVSDEGAERWRALDPNVKFYMRDD